MNAQALHRFREVVRRPLFSEKSTFDQERRNAYHFEVALDANKIEIRRAVEALFNVKVSAVNTRVRKGKIQRRGYAVGAKPSTKRAIVTLKAGQTIDYAG
jgi:large subunit ribosomal protein L23